MKCKHGKALDLVCRECERFAGTIQSGPLDPRFQPAGTIEYGQFVALQQGDGSLYGIGAPHLFASAQAVCAIFQCNLGRLIKVRVVSAD